MQIFLTIFLHEIIIFNGNNVDIPSSSTTINEPNIESELCRGKRIIKENFW